jgi:hypothetical protein
MPYVLMPDILRTNRRSALSGHEREARTCSTVPRIASGVLAVGICRVRHYQGSALRDTSNRRDLTRDK